MIYQIKLRISYEYESPAVRGRHILYLAPRSDGAAQTVLDYSVLVSPQPEERLDRVDFFGNPVTELGLAAPHKDIAFEMNARVQRVHHVPDFARSTALGQLRATLSQVRDMGPRSALHFLAPTARVPADPAMTAFARAATTTSVSVAEAVLALGHALHHHMRFDPNATTVDTPAAEAFAHGHGVCQDFSHIMIACLRGMGIPAGYVSGFLRTEPPKGQPRLEGADAMHAWVQAWCGPEMGWLEYDPTNDTVAGADHIVVAYGRDYSDVAPVKGALRVSGGQKSAQAVDVIPVSV